MARSGPIDSVRERTGPGAPAPVPFARILCAVDGSSAASVAARQALELAGTDAELTFISVCGGDATELDHARAFEALRTAGMLERPPGMRLTDQLVEHPDPRRALLEAAHSHDLLVLGAHGHSRAEGIVLGGAAALAVHACELPVLVARPTPHARPLGAHVLVASDGTPGSRPAGEIGGAIAARGGGHATLVHVARRDSRGERRELARESTDLLLATGTEPVALTVPGHPADAIADVAAEVAATLLVLGSRGLAGVRALTSVSERVAARAHCSVLVLRRA